jgi:ABC-type Na+ transport system ATPase subunit NatA
VISVQGLCKRYGATIAVDQVSFEVRAGEVTGLPGQRLAEAFLTLTGAAAGP